MRESVNSLNMLKRRQKIVEKFPSALKAVSYFDSSEDDDSLNLIPRVSIRRRSSNVGLRSRIAGQKSPVREKNLSPDRGINKYRYGQSHSRLGMKSKESLELKGPHENYLASKQGENPRTNTPGGINTSDSNAYLPSPSHTEERMHIGPYLIELGSVIGKGGFSTVYSVTDKKNQRLRYALKIVRVLSNVQDEVKQNLQKEVKIMASLVNAEHVIQLLAHDADDHSSVIHILMELGQGDLRQILMNCGDISRPLDVEFVRYWGGQVLKAVNAVHSRNIVHSDLKPANFILVNGTLKLCDFGIANPVPENTTNIRRSNAIGTLLYMAPETLKHSNDEVVYKVNKASDIWACGIILFEMVYKTYPYGDRTYLYKAENSELEEVEHPKVTPGDSPVPLALHEVIRDCLHLDPKLRIRAGEAARSVFFAPVSVDLQAVISMTRSTYKFAHNLGMQQRNLEPEKLEHMAKAFYKRLLNFNNGISS